MYYFYWLLFLPLAGGGHEENDYCGLKYQRLCKGKGIHVGCKYPNSGFGAACENSSTVQFTESLKNFILHFINRKRNKIAAGHEKVRGGERLPKPEIMMYVGWDTELAFLAQRFANQCLFTHDECRATERYPFAGQAVGAVRCGRLATGVRRVLDAWWAERRNVEVARLLAPFALSARDAAWGHFGQLAAWALAGVGCGGVRRGARPRLLLVCDFSHTNMLGQSTLRKGPPRPCPPRTARGASPAYPLLCAPINVERQDEPKFEEEDDDDRESEKDYDEYEHRSEIATNTRKTTEEATEPRTKMMRPRTMGYSGRDSYRNYEGARFGTEGSIELLNRRKLISEANMEIYGNNATGAPYGKWRNEYMHTKERPTEQHAASFPSVRFGPASTEITYSPRQRWKQTRNRPRRPGASALLSSPAGLIVVSKRPSAAPITLDKADMEQLYKDTGFQLGKRTHDRHA